MQHESQLRAQVRETFDSFLREATLIRTYSNLYQERSKIGVSEGFAMVNQRDAEVCEHCSGLVESTNTVFQVNLKMATESTQIARASHQDSRALRVIQILSMLFLPASLVSSIFGMGFFSTSQGSDGRAVLSVSSSWWWYIAICIPLTVLSMIFMGCYTMASRSKARRKPFVDAEKTPLTELKAE